MGPIHSCPCDVLELVISVLAVPDMFRLRTVCKEWNEIITTRAFQENGQLRFQKLQLLVVCKTNERCEFKAYNVEADKWHSFDLSFLPHIGEHRFCVLPFDVYNPLSSQRRARLPSPRSFEREKPFRVLDFAGGLACVMHNTGVLWALYVCNPLTKRWARLPSPPTSFNFSSPRVIVRTYYTRKTGHYKVFVVSGVCVKEGRMHWQKWMFNRLVVEEFDSSSWTWDEHSQSCGDGLWRVTEVAVLSCNNGNGASLFILLGCHTENQVFSLLFDEDKRSLGLVKIEAALPNNLLNPAMVCCEGQNPHPHPLLVSAVGDGNGATGFEIWELGNQLTEWRSLAAMASDLFTHFTSLFDIARHKFTPMSVVAYKHRLYIHPGTVVSWTIAYDILTRSWLWPSTKFPPHMNEYIGVRRCAFEPSLANVVSGPN